MCDSAWKTGRPTKDGWYCIRIWLEHSEQFSDPTIWEWCRDKFISRHHLPVRFDYDVDQWCEIPLPSEKSALQERLEEAEKVIDEFADGLNWQSAGIYEGKPSEVLLWSGWMRGKSNGPHLARSYRAKYPKE